MAVDDMYSAFDVILFELLNIGNLPSCYSDVIGKFFYSIYDFMDECDAIKRPVSFVVV